MDKLAGRLLFIFSTSMGIVIGGALLGSLATTLSGEGPGETMKKLAVELKLWAVIAAIGGTFDTIKVLEYGIFDGQLYTLFKQFLFIISSFFGAQLGQYLIETLAGGKNGL